MNTVASPEPLIRDAKVTRSEIVAYLADGRVISVPLAWSWRLSEATPAQRAKFRLIGAGQGIHWPEVDEDLSVEGMLHGSPAPRTAASQPAIEPVKRKASKSKVNGPARRRSAASAGGR